MDRKLAHPQTIQELFHPKAAFSEAIPPKSQRKLNNVC
jgi:hypothetical protein